MDKFRISKEEKDINLLGASLDRSTLFEGRLFLFVTWWVLTISSHLTQIFLIYILVNS